MITVKYFENDKLVREEAFKRYGPACAAQINWIREANGKNRMADLVFEKERDNG